MDSANTPPDDNVTLGGCYFSALINLLLGNLQGSDWNGQVKLGNGQFVGVNYLQSVTPNLALGGEAFWLGQQRKSGAGFAARYADKEHVATAQVATTGLVSLAYLRRLSEKVRLQQPCSAAASINVAHIWAS